MCILVAAYALFTLILHTNLRSVSHNFPFFPRDCVRSALLAMAMVAFFGMSFRSGAAVTAFSFASFSARSAAAVGAAGSKGIQRGIFGHRRAFHQSSTVSSTIDSKTSCAASATAAIELEKSLEVTHPAYEVIDRDVVTEYGAYCTRYRHKKSGAELLSVASDDDNKVHTDTLSRWTPLVWSAN